MLHDLNAALEENTQNMKYTAYNTQYRTKTKTFTKSEKLHNWYPDISIILIHF